MEDFGNLVYESKTYNIYRNGKNAYKIFNASVKKSHVLQEAINQTLAEETSISVPKIYQISPNQNDEWMISYEFVEGLSLNTLIDKHPEKQDMYIDYMIKLQTKIFNENAYSFNSLREKLQKRINESNLSPQIRCKLLTRLSVLPIQTKLCHGRFIPNNIVITKDKLPYVLDWGESTQGNGASDIANSYLLLRLNYGDDFAEKYLSKIEQKTEYTIKQVKRWVPIIAASLINYSEGETQEFYTMCANSIEFEDK